MSPSTGGPGDGPGAHRTDRPPPVRHDPPPRLAEALLNRLLPRHLRNEALGDLAETYHRRRARGSRADLWYWAQLLAVPAWVLADAVRSMRWDSAEVKRVFRGLARSPGFTALAVLSLGFGIGATTAIAGALEALLFQTLPVDRPGEIRLVYHSWPDTWRGNQIGSAGYTDPTDGAQVTSNMSFPAYEAIREQTLGPVQLAAYAFVREVSVVSEGPAIAAGGMLVSGEYFATLGLSMELGRPLNDADDRQGAPPVVVLSHAFWQRAFVGDSAIVGRTVRLNGQPVEVVGVTRRGYVGLSPGGFFGPSDVIVPIVHQASLLTYASMRARDATTSSDLHWVRVIARVPTGFDIEPLRRELSAALGRHLVESGIVDADTESDVDVRLLDGSRGLDSLRSGTEGPLRILSVVVALVLLVACANLATLLLARGTARSGEYVVRRAVGASRWDLVWPQLLESSLLALSGSALGLMLALRGGPILVAALTRGAGNAAVRFELSPALIAAAASAGLIAAVLSGLIPALRITGTAPGGHLGARAQTGSASRLTLGRALIVAQIAVSVPLVVGALLFLRTLGNLAAVELGFETEGLVVFRVDASLATTDTDRAGELHARILDDLRTTPGVRSAAAVENVLVSGWMSNTGVVVDGERVMMSMNAVSPDFFRTMGIPLRAGRTIGPGDDADGPLVALVNETAERELFGGSAVGRRFEVDDRPVEVIGVVGDAKYESLRRDVAPTFYDPIEQRAGSGTRHYVVRAAGPPVALQEAIRQVVARADPGLPVTGFQSQGDAIERAAARERTLARLLSLFGAFVLVLSSIGLHGVTAFTVARRTSEIGVRMALGAERVGILGMVLRQVLAVTVVGLIAGLGIAVAAGRVVASLLFGLQPTDLATLLAAAGTLLAVSIAAGWIPALRASRVDPLVALSADG